MSVIFGIKAENTILIASDRRVSRSNGTCLNDDKKKIYVINERLAYASAGVPVIGTMINMDVNKLSNKETLTVDGLIKIIKKFYNRAVEEVVKYKAFFIIGGITESRGATLYAIINKNRNLDIAETPMIMFPPMNLTRETCGSILFRNLKDNNVDYVERTIHEISEQSKFVSRNGDKWIYNIEHEKGNLISFD